MLNEEEFTDLVIRTVTYKAGFALVFLGSIIAFFVCYWFESRWGMGCSVAAWFGSWWLLDRAKKLSRQIQIEFDQSDKLPDAQNSLSPLGLPVPSLVRGPFDRSSIPTPCPTPR